jgi:hypothetical protein
VKIDEINSNQFNWNSVFHLRSEDGRCSMLKKAKDRPMPHFWKVDEGSKTHRQFVAKRE